MKKQRLKDSEGHRSSLTKKTKVIYLSDLKYFFYDFQ